MISEHELASSFNGFWESLFPLLSPSFVRDFNLRQTKRVPYHRSRFMQPVPFIEGKEYADIIAELAFELFKMGWQSNGDSKDSDIRKEHFERARTLVAKRFLAHQTRFSVQWLLAQKRIPSEVSSLVNVYSSFFSKLYGSAALNFRPILKGAGFLKTVEADICCTESLFEVKTVKRNLTSHDFRQILTYIALGMSSGEFAWQEAVFFNPRRAIFYSFNIVTLVSYLSARSARDALDEFIYFLSERELASGVL